MNFLTNIKNKISKNEIYRIVFSGDSLTSADWIHPNFREIIEYVLKWELSIQTGGWKKPSWNIRCVNSGLDGATSSDILNLIDINILFYKPSLVILMVGINDLGLGNSIDTFISNLTEIFKIFKKNKIPAVYITSPQTGNEKLNNEFQKYNDAAKTVKHLPDLYIDLFEEFKTLPRTGFYTSISDDGNADYAIKPGSIDFLHPNILGNAYIAKILLKQIFNIPFDPELYIKETAEEKMNPQY